MTARSAAVLVAGAAVAFHAGPSVLTLRRLRGVVAPALAGVGDPGHVALTFDDGPDPRTTPAVLDALAALDVRATFFVLGDALARHPDLARRLVADGHEVGLHGGRHRPALLVDPVSQVADVRRAREVVTATTGVTPRVWRPPHGILTGPALAAAVTAGLRPVLWTTWGRDWRHQSVADLVDRVQRTSRPGATVLLHDASPASAPDAWRTTVAALPVLVARWRGRGLTVGPLRDHDGHRDRDGHGDGGCAAPAGR